MPTCIYRKERQENCWLPDDRRFRSTTATPHSRRDPCCIATSRPSVRWGLLQWERKPCRPRGLRQSRPWRCFNPLPSTFTQWTIRGWTTTSTSVPCWYQVSSCSSSSSSPLIPSVRNWSSSHPTNWWGLRETTSMWPCWGNCCPTHWYSSRSPTAICGTSSASFTSRIRVVCGCCCC